MLLQNDNHTRPCRSWSNCVTIGCVGLLGALALTKWTAFKVAVTAESVRPPLAIATKLVLPPVLSNNSWPMPPAGRVYVFHHVPKTGGAYLASEYLVGKASVEPVFSKIMTPCHRTDAGDSGGGLETPDSLRICRHLLRDPPPHTHTPCSLCPPKAT